MFPVQFRQFGLQRLIEPYGEFSPMGSLWSFMAASTPYTIFAGTSEVLGGLLLLFRRTVTLGSLVAFGVLVNVVMMNFCYDVPVKLYSTNLLLMAGYLASRDLRRLFGFFIGNRATSPANLTYPRFRRRGLRLAAILFQIVFVGNVLFDSIDSGWKSYQTVRIHPVRPPIYGLWEVETFTRNGLDVPALVTDGTRWRTLVADYPGSVTVRMMNDVTKGYAAEYDAAKKTVALTAADEPEQRPKDTLSYDRPDIDHLSIEGSVSNDRISMRLRKIDTSGFLLLSRGFHWIEEVPLNR